MQKQNKSPSVADAQQRPVDGKSSTPRTAGKPQPLDHKTLRQVGGGVGTTELPNRTW